MEIGAQHYCDHVFLYIFILSSKNKIIILGCQLKKPHRRGSREGRDCMWRGSCCISVENWSTAPDRRTHRLGSERSVGSRRCRRRGSWWSSHCCRRSSGWTDKVLLLVLVMVLLMVLGVVRGRRGSRPGSWGDLLHRWPSPRSYQETRGRRRGWCPASHSQRRTEK